MNPCLLDTDILSEVFKRWDQVVVDNANAYLKVHDQLAISAFSKFEVVRGLRWHDATAKLAAFEKMCQATTIYPVTAEVLDRAAELWAIGAKQGKPKMDADIIIAATALVECRELVTGNISHFDWISGLTITSWRQ